MVRRFALLFGLLSGCAAGPIASAPNDKLGQPVSFSLPSNEGALVSVPAAGAHRTVLDFFGPSCEPCRKALPALYQQRGVLAAHGAQLLLVAVLAGGESTDDARRALASWGVNAPFLVDSEGTGRREAGVMNLPATLVLDEHGVTKWSAPAGASAADVLAAAE
ncbi:MAG TPA: TlpA disulfide reductase family protein [Polyangiaceae bacterium]|jgi:thiol-disulfide isomerase/thioredoxin